LRYIIKPSPTEAEREFAENGRPLITIGVTTYNRPQMLRECVASILSQSYPNIEIIIGNDFVKQPVTFDSLGVHNDPRVRIVNHPQNIGAFNNNRYVLREAHGDWFTWLADDDLMHPEYLQIAYKVLSKCEVTSVFANYVAEPDPYGIFPAKLHTVIPQILSGREFIDKYTSRSIRTVGNSGVFRRELFKHLGNVQASITGGRFYWDTFMPIFAATFGNVAYVDLDLIFLRTHASSHSVGPESPIKAYSCAQEDFIVEFEQRCKHFLEADEYERQLMNMLKWFAADGWHLICRKHASVPRRLSSFYQYLIDTIVPRLPVRFKGAFGLFASTMAVGDSVRYVASRVLRAMKAWS